MPEISANSPKKNKLALIKLVNSLSLNEEIQEAFAASLNRNPDDPELVGRELLGLINEANPQNPVAVNPKQSENFPELLAQIKTAAEAPIAPSAPPAASAQGRAAEVVRPPLPPHPETQKEPRLQETPDAPEILNFVPGPVVLDTRQPEEKPRNNLSSHDWTQHIQSLQDIWTAHAPHVFQSPMLPNGVQSHFHQPNANQFDVHTDRGTISYTRDAVTFDSRQTQSMDDDRMKALVLTAKEHAQKMWPGHSLVLECNDRGARFTMAAHMLASGVALVGNPPPFELKPPLSTDLDMTAIVTESQRLKDTGLYPQTPVKSAGPTLPQPLPISKTQPQPVI